jgi:hypothetical protein
MRTRSLFRRFVPLLGLITLGTALGVATGSCAKSAKVTELVLVAGSDIPVKKPKEGGPYLVGITFRIQDAEHKRPAQVIPQDLATAPALPLFLGLVDKDEGLGRIEVEAVGYLSDRTEVRRRHIVRFYRGEILQVPLHLMKQCHRNPNYCTGEANPMCSEHGCVPVELTRAELKPWHGKPEDIPSTDVSPSTGDDAGPHMQPDAATPSHDGGKKPMPPDSDGNDASPTGDGDGDVPGDGDDQDPTLDSGPIGDGDGPSDGGPTMCVTMDLLVDPLHCGQCGNKCVAYPFTINSCSRGECECEAGYANCDHLAGCETDLSNKKHCGSCTKACDNATEKCENFACVPKH